MNATALRELAAVIRESRDDEVEDTLAEIVKRLDAIEHAVGAVAQGVMKLQQED